MHCTSVSLRVMSRCRVAVIGAGAAGLAAARELRSEGHEVSVFESGSVVGGTWVYSEVPGHSSMYESLRTNLPRELMAYADFSWSSPCTSDCRNYPGHTEVLAYLARFCSVNALESMIHFNTRVVSAERHGSNGWQLCLETGIPGERRHRLVEFDALCVCNGHYSAPRIPDIPGLGDFKATRPGAVVHTHDYRRPGPWRGLKVLVVGSAASGEDVSRELATVAREVLWSGHSFTSARVGGALCTRPDVASVAADGRVVFTDGTSETIDTILLATGYHFRFPFLGADVLRGLGYSDNCFDALFEHLYSPADYPTLFFIGLPWKVVPFPIFELQSRLAARILSGSVPAPTLAAVRDWRVAWEARLSKGMPRRHAHALSVDEQFDYCDRLADAARTPRLPAWRRRAYIENGANKRANPDTYRDSALVTCA
jgi:hypothetical protein